MSDKQMNLFMKKADMERKIKVPASIEKKTKELLEPEEQKNVVVVDRRIEDKCPKCGGDLKGGETSCHCEHRECAQQSGPVNHTHIPTICPMCKQDKELRWVNPGGLGANTEICKDCIPKLFEGYGYNEPGFRVIDEKTVEIFSETTGWERIRTYWVKEFFKNIFPNDLFPLCVYVQHPEIGERNKQGDSFGLDHNTYGITWAAARFLSIKANVPIPEDLVRHILQGGKR